jgi:hypothetical protein
MAAIKWCMRQKRGIKLVEPNDNLCNEYIATAQETLEILRTIKGKSKVWLATTKYYCEYFAVYAILMKAGIKCEIHECTIAVAGLLEEKGIVPKGTQKQLEDDKQLRIDNQYYLKNREVPIDYGELVRFVLTLKDKALRLTNEEVKGIKDALSKK